MPNAKTLRLFREPLARHGFTKKAFEWFDEQLSQSALTPQGGQIIDASLVSSSTAGCRHVGRADGDFRAT